MYKKLLGEFNFMIVKKEYKGHSQNSFNHQKILVL